MFPLSFLWHRLQGWGAWGGGGVGKSESLLGTAPKAELEHCLRIAGTFYFGSSAPAQDRQLAFSSFIEFSISVSREMIQTWGDALICNKQVPSGTPAETGPFGCLLMVPGPCCGSVLSWLLTQPRIHTAGVTDSNLGLESPTGSSTRISMSQILCLCLTLCHLVGCTSHCVAWVHTSFPFHD